MSAACFACWRAEKNPITVATNCRYSSCCETVRPSRSSLRPIVRRMSWDGGKDSAFFLRSCEGAFRTRIPHTEKCKDFDSLPLSRFEDNATEVGHRKAGILIPWTRWCGSIGVLTISRRRGPPSMKTSLVRWRSNRQSSRKPRHCLLLNCQSYNERLSSQFSFHQTHWADKAVIRSG